MDRPLSEKLASLGLISQCKLKDILSSCGDKKDLIIDPALIKQLERICGVNWLRQHGIDKIYKMDKNLGTTANTNRVYFIQSCMLKYKCVLDQISTILIDNPDLADLNCFHIILVPKVLAAFDSVLENKGLYGIVKNYSFTWELMAVDEQLLSLELPFFFKELFVEHDHSLLSSISMSLWSLFHVTGKPKAVFSLGELSSKVLNMLEIHNETYARDFIDTNESKDFDALIIIDRNQDYASSLLTPATYSGLLSELFSINCGYLDLNVKESKLNKGKLTFEPQESGSINKTLMPLDSSIDHLYGEIKYRHFSEVLSVLRSKAKLLKNEDIKALGIQEMKQFVATKLQQVALYKQNLVNHVLACETIISEMSNKFEKLKLVETEMLNNRSKNLNYAYVEAIFSTDTHIYNSLRLMCLMSLTQSLTYDEHNTLILKYLLAFGYKYLYVFENLIKAGLLIQTESPKPTLMSNLGNFTDRLPIWQNVFQLCAHKLKQLPSLPDRFNKAAPSYVFHGGYVPLIAVLCNALLTSDTLSEVLAKLQVLTDLRVGGTIFEILKNSMETFDETLSNIKQNSAIEFASRDVKSLSKILKSDPNLGGCFPLEKKTVLVYVVGGVNFAEIAACNVIQTNTGSKIYIASDSICTGADLMAANT